jgi:thiol:disulfide interchange protein DsbD
VDPNWGEQLTNPVFLAVMIMLLFVFGLNMAGLFEFCTSLTGVGGELQTRKGYAGSFFSGVLTTLIATPCSAPFLGSVMAYALNLNATQGMLLFTVFALGISVPYVVLAFLPNLINKLPRPGAWMVTFKQLMSFALFATAAYFYQSFAKITGVNGASWLLMAIVLVALAVWAFGRFGTPFTPKTKRILWGFAFPAIVTCVAFTITKSATTERAPTPPLSGSSWYPGVVEQNRAKKRIVWVDYTADW